LFSRLSAAPERGRARLDRRKANSSFKPHSAGALSVRRPLKLVPVSERAAPGPARDGACRVLLIGEGQLADATHGALEAGGADVVRLEAPSDHEIRGAVDGAAGAVVVSRSDVAALRSTVA